jgi:hypothetical protein
MRVGRVDIGHVSTPFWRNGWFDIVVDTSRREQSARAALVDGDSRLRR